MKLAHRASVFTAAIAFYLTAHASGDILIEVSPSLLVMGPEVLLRDLATNPAQLPDGWGDRTVIRAPEPGRRAEHSIFAIAHALQKYPDMNDVLLHGHQSIAVRRSGTGLGADKVFKAVKNYIRNDDRWSETTVEIECEPIEDYMHIPPESDIRIEVRNCVPERETNRYRLEVALADPEGAITQTVRAYARIIPMTEVWVTRRAMSAGDSPGADDIAPGLVSADASARYVPATESVSGLELTRRINANEPLPRRLLVEPICARRGDVINVVAQSGNLTVTARATALSTGRRGDHILCVNESSDRRLRVRLTGTRRAEIDLGESG